MIWANAAESNDIQRDEGGEPGEQRLDDGLAVQRAGQYLCQMIQRQEITTPLLERVALAGEQVVRLCEFLRQVTHGAKGVPIDKTILERCQQSGSRNRTREVVKRPNS